MRISDWSSDVCSSDLDLVGPLEVFADANDGLGRAAYELTVAAVEPGQVRTSSGLGVVADVALADVRGKVDTLVVVGGDGTYEVYDDEELNAQVRRLAGSATRVTTVCSGAFVLANAGRLDRRRATTHSRACWMLAPAFPSVPVGP